jgi:LDH2 family malate/lactate/ureidoglycolate dehydrogenase
MRATEQGLVVMIMASTPSETAVAAHGGTSRIFSCNPIAVGIPTLGRPILIDTSASMSALGPLFRAHREGVSLDGNYLINADGSTSADPASYVDSSAAILPAGGVEQGYKGFAWAIIIEALSAALTGYGRATEASSGDGEANAVFVQAIAPGFFGGIDAFKKQMTWLGDTCRASDVAGGRPPVRMPGDRALALRDEQLRVGLSVEPLILADLEAWGRRLGVEQPWASSSRL